MPNRSRAARQLRDAFPRDQLEPCLRSVGNADAWRALRKNAIARFLERNTELVRRFSLGSWASFEWDMDAATLAFFDEERPRVVANIEFAGTYARVPKTWMWSWANPSVSAAVSGRMSRVRDYGRQHDITPLHADHWHATEERAQELTAVTSFLLDGLGGYRVPGCMPGTTIYIVIMDAQWVT